MELKNNLVIDYDTFYSAIEEILLEDSTVFKSLYPGSTANIFVEALAGYASMLMYRLQTAISNSFLKTAFSEYSIFSIAEMLGTIIRGNSGSVIDLILSRKPFEGPTSLPVFIIPSHTSFTIKNTLFYNREPLTFPSSYTNIAVTLYQGEVRVQEYTTTGALNEKFIFGSDFETDINYVKVYVNGVEWKTDYETLMDYSVDEYNSTEFVQTVLLKTNVDGTCYIQFGNGLYGALPPEGSIVKIVYASTKGSEGNFSGATGIVINENLTFGSQVLEVYSDSIGSATGGTDRLDAESLKYISPRLFASNNRAVKRSDYIGQLMYEANYKDCNFWGEYEEALKEGYADNSMMNRVYYTAITNDFSVKNIAFCTGDGTTTDFTKNVSSIIMFPGSVEVSSSLETFRDFSGAGYMFSLASDYTIKKSTLLEDKTDIKCDSVGNYCNVTATLTCDEFEGVAFKFKVYNEECTLKPPVFESEIQDRKYYFSFPGVESKTFVIGEEYKDIEVYYKTFATSTETKVYLTNPSLTIFNIEKVKNPIENVLIERDMEGACINADVYYTSSRNPTSLNPIIIEFKLPEDKVLSGIRLMSTPYSTAEDRCFPSKCLILGSRKEEPTKKLENYLSDNDDDYWSFAQLMSDQEWDHLTSAVSLEEPGVSAWSDWVGVDTLADSYTVKIYKKGGIVDEVRENKYKWYRLIILGKHGDQEQPSTKICKIAFMCKGDASTINYETGDCTIKFLNPPIIGEDVKAVTIGDKLSDYQKLRDYNFLRNINHFTTEVECKELKLKRVDIHVNVIYSNSVDLSVLKGKVENAILDMFKVTQGCIGQSLRISNLYSTIMGVEGVVYCTKTLPVSDIEANVDEILYLSDLRIDYTSSARLGG